MNALICGASGGLATWLAHHLLARDWTIDLVTRSTKKQQVADRFADALRTRRARVFAVDKKYSSLTLEQNMEQDLGQRYRAYFFTQALFSPKAIVATEIADIESEMEVGLVDIMQLVRKLLLLQHPPEAGDRRDYCFIGSTSAYAGFRNSAVYCAVKHGLLGFVRALNDEYAHTNTRFWLFSMGTMNTAMGGLVTEQDPATYLQPGDVAGRIVEAICSSSNIFEPEVILRRRTMR